MVLPSKVALHSLQAQEISTLDHLGSRHKHTRPPTYCKPQNEKRPCRKWGATLVVFKHNFRNRRAEFTIKTHEMLPYLGAGPGEDRKFSIKHDEQNACVEHGGRFCSGFATKSCASEPPGSRNIHTKQPKLEKYAHETITML